MEGQYLGTWYSGTEYEVSTHLWMMGSRQAPRIPPRGTSWYPLLRTESTKYDGSGVQYWS
jgi:hypothetical protein